MCLNTIFLSVRKLYVYMCMYILYALILTTWFIA